MFCVCMLQHNRVEPTARHGTRGPGRHGPGNNLFFMFKDPHGDPVELSAEIEVMDRDTPPRTWPHTEKTLNLWGPGWIRD